jgi:hypothetical protein
MPEPSRRACCVGSQSVRNTVLAGAAMRRATDRGGQAPASTCDCTSRARSSGYSVSVVVHSSGRVHQRDASMVARSSSVHPSVLGSNRSTRATK